MLWKATKAVCWGTAVCLFCSSLQIKLHWGCNNWPLIPTVPQAKPRPSVVNLLHTFQHFQHLSPGIMSQKYMLPLRLSPAIKAQRWFQCMKGSVFAVKIRKLIFMIFNWHLTGKLVSTHQHAKWVQVWENQSVRRDTAGRVSAHCNFVKSGVRTDNSSAQTTQQNLVQPR